MREILFRGESIDTGGWLYGNLTDTSDSERAQIWVRNEYGGLDNSLVDARTVGQFTGLTDKNGQKIFEGDIVQCKGRISSAVFIGKVVFRCGSFVAEDEENVCFPLPGCEVCVTGNIHDNPELLEDGAR